MTSFLYHYLSSKLEEEKFQNKTEIVLFSDAAGSQNKNSVMCQFLSWFSSKKHKNFEQIFPVRGHSYGQNDRNFGSYGQKIKRKETITHYKKYLEIMATARENNPFKVMKDASLIKDFQTALSSIFTDKKPKCITGNTPFKIQQYVRIKYFPNGEVHASPSYYAMYTKFKYTRKQNAFVHLRQVPPPGLKAAKKKDLETLLEFMKPENRQWLKDIIEVK